MSHRANSLLATMFLVISASVANAGFVVTVDSNDLQHNGPGTHSVDLFLSHDTVGDDTLDGLRFDVFNASNAAVQQGPINTAFTGSFLSANINSSNQFAIGAASPFTVPATPGGRLGTFVFDVTDNEDFTIGLNFVEATRNFAAIGEPVVVPASFTVIGPVSVPEPSAILPLVFIAFILGSRRKRK